MKPNRLEAQVGGIEMIDIRRGGLHLQREVRESGPQGFWGRLGTLFCALTSRGGRWM